MKKIFTLEEIFIIDNTITWTLMFRSKFRNSNLDWVYGPLSFEYEKSISSCLDLVYNKFGQNQKTQTKIYTEAIYLNDLKFLIKD